MLRAAPRAPLLVALLASATASALAGCAGERRSGSTVRETTLASVALDPAGPWTERSASEMDPGILRQERSVAVNSSVPAQPPLPGRGREPAAAPTRPPPPQPPAPRAPVPLARGTGQVPAPGAPPVKSLEDAARERFLDQPTEVRAESLTLVVPERLVAEVRLTGAQVSEPGAGRRQAVGAARLTCRELTLVGERITLRTRPPGSEDVQITARGGVSFVSRRGDQVQREEGVKTLIVTNDAVTPLR